MSPGTYTASELRVPGPRVRVPDLRAYVPYSWVQTACRHMFAIWCS